ncbi:unnamed protein product [Heligmosomoides polygyrus]|uniref:N-acetyltransferase domain-containing protein n=1 Tax=Heligmosomoides polygyrus TaxID=6339 RepID=A0A183FUG8_HELPZ|nr:unnamed protein product [Heligmosomoides polygyrus]
MNRYELLPLYHRQDLNQSCINLLNQEWPRSDGSREHSQSKSCRLTPPMSFLFIEKDTDRLIGHARICLLPNRPTSCWIESVIVERSCRGLGLGKLLMASLEDAAKGFGFDEAFLCTDDQVIFYERCGYMKCDPILHSTTATSVFPVTSSSAKGSFTPSVSIPSSLSCLTTGAPPPPPPAPPKKATTAPISTVGHQYMCKKLT